MGISRTPGGQQMMIPNGNPSSTKDSGSHNHFQQIKGNAKITRLIQEKEKKKKKRKKERRDKKPAKSKGIKTDDLGKSQGIPLSRKRERKMT